MDLDTEKILKRFEDYISYNTQSDEENDQVYPSTPGQMVLARHLKEELEQLGLDVGCMSEVQILRYALLRDMVDLRMGRFEFDNKEAIGNYMYENRDTYSPARYGHYFRFETTLGLIYQDLDQLKIGDIFFIHVLNETLAYAVDDISTVLPEDTSQLAIERDKDLVTLITCTPFGVNTHRLLVRGSRIDYDAQTVVADIESLEPEAAGSTWVNEYIKGIVLGVIILILAVIAYMVMRRGQNG